MRRPFGMEGGAQAGEFGRLGFDGRDLAALNPAGGDKAGTDRLPVQQHRAGAAIAGIAADLGATPAQPFAQDKAEPFPRRGIGFDWRAVEVKADHSAPSTARETSAAAACCR
ncbi:hypothetical protein MASR1M32_28330 [Rhodobacter sp.]